MFNAKSKEVKRGQAIVPIKFFSGGAYEDMKGSALVRVYQGVFVLALWLSDCETLTTVMAIQVVEFSIRGYKIR